MSDAIERLCAHAAETASEAIPAQARAAAARFVLDSAGVGVAGSRGPHAGDLVATFARADGEARAWGRAARLPAPAAALVNAYQIHNAEFDCVHERAVVHPMAVLLGAVAAQVDRAGRPTPGRDLIDAVALGVDVACTVGVASRAPLRFFRPATAGAFAATAAVGRLMGFDAETLVGAMGVVYGQLCGTMQAHVEGSALLAMQVGFNARNAVVACDLAAVGVRGPRAVLEGPFGYFALYEGEHDLPGAMAEVGRVWRVTEVAHKPFPSGRATHGVVDACMELAAEHGFAAADVERIVARVPPLTHRLVGRPVAEGMAPNYARLCGAYVAARALLAGAVGIEDFEPAALADADSLALARRIAVEVDDNPDPNALTPVTVEVALADGARHARTLDVVYGNPAKPMARAAYLEKFRRNWRASAEPLPAEGCEAAIAALEAIETAPDARAVLARLSP